jgi:hypothetical protein
MLLGEDFMAERLLFRLQVGQEKAKLERGLLFP